MIKFPKNFKFGGSTSGPQTEGSKNKPNINVFDYWYQKEPEAFFNQIGPTITSDIYHHYQDDIQLLKKVGIQIYRTSIQWTRLIKNFQTNEINWEAVEFYRDYFKEIKNANIELIVNLYHFDTPMYWQNKGGWLNKEFTDAFANYAKICFELFGDLVDSWATMNEPIVIAQAAYINGEWYPKIKDFKQGIQVIYNEILASAKAIQEFRKILPNKKICIFLNLSPAYPNNINDAESIKAVKNANLFHNKVFLDSTIKGIFPKELKDYLIELKALPIYNNEELKIIKNNTIDFLGVNYYAPFRVQPPLKENKHKLDLSKYYENYNWPQAKMNIYRGWEIYPQGLKNIAEIIQKDYDNIPWFVSENGMGAPSTLEDDFRIEFIYDHVKVLGKAIEKGANCFAYCLWSPLDCWSWANAYKNRYGLISVDLKTQTRTIRKSGAFFKKLSDKKEI